MDGKALLEDTKKNKEVTTGSKISNKKASPKKQAVKQAAIENKTKTAKAESNKTASPKEQAAKQTSKNLEDKKSAGLKSEVSIIQ